MLEKGRLILCYYYYCAAVPSAPRGLLLTLTQEDPPMVAVTWQTPRLIHGPTVDGYKLTYGIRGDSYTEERRFEGDRFRFTTGALGTVSSIRACSIDEFHVA